MPRQLISIGWYEQDDYEAIKRLMTDSEKLPGTYEQWLAGATKGMEHAQATGQVAIKAKIHSVEFGRWCAERGLEPNAKARMEFGSHIAAAHAKELGWL